MVDQSRGFLLRQFETAWKLTRYHLDGLTTEECLWRPANIGPHVHKDLRGIWRADWPDREGYGIGAPSIAWISWHIGFWWSMVLNHSFGDRSLSREDISWPGSAEDARDWIGLLQSRWHAELKRVTEEQMMSTNWTLWPFQNRPFGDVIAWVNVELTKNASEIGYARFLHAAKAAEGPGDA